MALNCGALPETVIESELFGHEAGAFTGAQRKRIGRIEHSGGGTLFLDEIESMPIALQVKLLRVLETRSVTPLGSNETRRVDLRVVAATKVDLGQAVTARRVPRGSLLSPQRRDAARPAAARAPQRHSHAVRALPRRAAERFGRPVPAVNAAVSDHLQSHGWAGNVRELVHFADRVALGLGPTDATTNAAAPAAEREVTVPLPEKVGRYEADVIREALREHGGDVRRAIDALGVPRKTFYDKLKRYGISASEFRPDGAADRASAGGET